MNALVEIHDYEKAPYVSLVVIAIRIPATSCREGLGNVVLLWASANLLLEWRYAPALALSSLHPERRGAGVE